MITREQCRAARALLDWSRAKLAEASSVSERTITDFERGARNPINSSLIAIRLGLENAGVEFIAENGGGPGVRLKKADAG
ncbi:MAG: helix-turn-helix transcriptional regulator [Pseudomonadota bacterium]